MPSARLPSCAEMKISDLSTSAPAFAKPSMIAVRTCRVARLDVVADAARDLVAAGAVAACIMIMGAHAADNCIIAVYGGLMSRRNFHISGAAIGSGVRLCGLWGPLLWCGIIISTVALRGAITGLVHHD